MRFFLPLALAIVSLSPAAPASDLVSADLKPPTVGAWNDYVGRVEARVEQELQTLKPFLVLERLPQAEQQKAAASLTSGAVFITRLPGPNLSTRSPDIPDGLVHHWLGVVRIRGVRVDDVLAFVQRYDESPRFFKDAIASSFTRNGDEFEVFLKLKRETSVLIWNVTTVYNTTHRVKYRRLDATHAASRSVSTRIAELADSDRPSGPEKPIGHDSGYLWRLNSYWRFVETADGVTVECESLTLSRDIPAGFGLVAGGFVNRIARDSVEGTLGSIRKALSREP
jgi:hypothetical protein